MDKYLGSNQLIQVCITPNKPEYLASCKCLYDMFCHIFYLTLQIDPHLPGFLYWLLYWNMVAAQADS